MGECWGMRRRAGDGRVMIGILTHGVVFLHISGSNRAHLDDPSGGLDLRSLTCVLQSVPRHVSCRLNFSFLHSSSPPLLLSLRTFFCS